MWTQHSRSARNHQRAKRFLPRLLPLEDRSLPAAAIPGVTLDPLTIPKFVNSLPAQLAFGDPFFVYTPTDTTTATLENGSTATVPLYQVGAFQIQENLGL